MVKVSEDERVRKKSPRDGAMSAVGKSKPGAEV